MTLDDRFDQFFDQHWSAVLAYARRRTPTADDAHDVAAETFAVAWRRFADIPAHRPEAWLYTTAANVLANHRRGDQRRSHLRDRLAQEPARPRQHAVDIAIDDEAILVAFATLTEDQQELLRLVAWEGLDHKTIAEILGTTANGVALRLRRARARLSEALHDVETTDAAVPGHEPDDRPGRTS